MLFLEASDAALVAALRERAQAAPACRARARYSTASPRERELLREIRGDSDIVLDTSALNVHELRARMHGYFGGDSADRRCG